MTPQTSNHSANLLHIATVRTHDAVVPSDRILTRPHLGHTAVTHGMMRTSMDSMVSISFPSPISAEA